MTDNQFCEFVDEMLRSARKAQRQVYNGWENRDSSEIEDGLAEVGRISDHLFSNEKKYRDTGNELRTRLKIEDSEFPVVRNKDIRNTIIHINERRATAYRKDPRCNTFTNVHFEGISEQAAIRLIDSPAFFRSKFLGQSGEYVVDNDSVNVYDLLKDLSGLVLRLEPYVDDFPNRIE